MRMRTFLIRRLAALALLACPAIGFSWWGDTGTLNRKKEEEAILNLLVAQVADWNKGDLDRFMTAYWQSDDLTFFSGKEPVRGWKKTLERYRKRYQAEGQAMGKLSFSELKIEVLGPEGAWARGRWHLEHGKENFGGLLTLILKKKPAGWRIVHDHTSGS